MERDKKIVAPFKARKHAPVVVNVEEIIYEFILEKSTFF